LYIESSRRGNKYDKAHLESAMYVSSSGRCEMSFWYSMFGDDVGSLTAYLKKEDGSRQALFERTGNQGKEWQQV